MRLLRTTLQDMIDGLEASSSVSGLTSVADRTAKRLGFRWFAYLESSQGDPTIISTYPKAWVQHYQDQHFERIDPVVKRQPIPKAFFWSDRDQWPGQAQRQLFDEAKAFQIRCGVTVPIQVGGCGHAAFTLAGNEPDSELQRCAIEGMDLLQLMGLYFHSHAYAKIRLGLGQRGDAALTPREAQCLGWAARGKTRADTAQILDVTPRTVEFHLDNARTKLKAQTVAQAVAEAMRRELIRLN